MASSDTRFFHEARLDYVEFVASTTDPPPDKWCLPPGLSATEWQGYHFRFVPTGALTHWLAVQAYDGDGIGKGDGSGTPGTYREIVRWVDRQSNEAISGVIDLESESAALPESGGAVGELSVADAGANEANGSIGFVVTLDPAATDTVTVDYETEDGTAIAGDDYTATSGTLTFDVGEAQKIITVPLIDDTVEDSGETFKLALSNANGAEVADGEATGSILNAEPNLPATGQPTTSGTPQVGGILRAVTAGIADTNGMTNASFNYQWVWSKGDDDTDIPGATASTYTLRSSDEGRTVRVRVSFTDDAGYEEALTSGPAGPVAPRPDSPLADGESPLWFADMLVVEYTEVSIGAASPDLFSNQGGSAGLQAIRLWHFAPDRELYLAFTGPIPGDDDLTLLVGDLTLAFSAGVSGDSAFTWKDVDVDWEDGQTIVVRIVPTSALVEPTPNSPAVGAPAISGTAQVGETLTADTSGIADADGLSDAAFSYQWLADDANIQGATNSTYTLANSDEGKAIKVKVSFTDDADNQETLTSAATATVAAKSNSPATGQPTISGTPQVDETLTADTSGIADADGLTSATFSYQWIRSDGGTHSDIEGATNSTYELQADDEGKTVKVRVTFTDDGGNEETLTSAATATVAARPNNPATGLPAISGTAQVDETLTADTNGIADADGLTSATFSYQWIANDGTTDTDISGATGRTYALDADDEGKTVKVRVTFTDDASNQETLTSAATAEVAAKPNSPATGAPTISGTAQVGETLTADTTGIGDADGLESAVLGYQWTRTHGGTNSDIEGATGSTYTLGSNEVGKSINVRVDFTDDRGNQESLTSQAVGPVDHQVSQQQVNSPASGLPTISGTVQVDETLTAVTSGIADADGLTSATFSYQWIRNDGTTDTDISGATGQTYALDADDEGKTVKVRVSFTDDRGNEETLTSAATVAVKAVGAEPTDRPHGLTATVSGDAIILTWKEPVPDPGVDLYQILRHRPELGEPKPLVYVDYAESSDSTFTDTEVEPGVIYVYRVKAAVDVFGYLGEASDAAEVRMPDSQGISEPDPPAPEETNTPATGAPAITGTSQVGETLTADTADIADADGLERASFSYQWIRNDGDDADIQGATASTYTLDADDEGKTVKVRVSFTDDEGHAETLTSAATAEVAARPNSPATGAPAISGTAQVGDTLTADTSGIADADGLTSATFSYQWLSSRDTEIQDASASTYTLVGDDEGKTIKVRVSFTDDADNEETLTSAATAQVAAKPSSPATGAPTIGGTAQVGETLTAVTTGIADEDGLTSATFSYQWIANDGTTDADIPGATGRTYTLDADDEGKTVKVRVSFTDDADNDETLTSAATVAVAGLPPEPLTASLENTPPSHDGQTAFSFEMRFSEEFGLSYKTLKFHAFTVTGGTVTKAQRLEKPSNILWRITVVPDSNADVTIVLPATEDCGDPGAICTEDGRRLSSRLELTVSGPGQ